METSAQIRERWRYLRDLLIEQLSRFEEGTMQLHSDGRNVSDGAIARLKQNIIDFDEMISVSERRDS